MRLAGAGGDPPIYGADIITLLIVTHFGKFHAAAFDQAGSVTGHGRAGFSLPVTQSAGDILAGKQLGLTQVEAVGKQWQ
ncbi:hypothetical protein TUM4442_24960 [Shewanella algae]|nr:hypothetical protein TUM4442_24960 [Shewanella algae]